MAFFTVSTNEENVRDYTPSNGQYINQSGIYEVIIKAVVVDQTAKGSQYLNLWLEHKGKEQPIYQAIRLTNNDGSANFGQQLFTKFCIVAGLGDNAEVSDPTPRMIPMGKGGSDVECMVLEEFTDIPMFMRVQMEYSMYNGNIQETKNIRNFFRYEDKATASEIVNNVEDKGSQYEKEEEYADKVSYKDGLTEEDIVEWKKNRKAGAKEVDKKPATGFGVKRTFGKK